MDIHTTMPGGYEARCGNAFGDTVPWEQVVDEAQPAMVTCSECIESIRDHSRPRWLDEHLWPPGRS